MNDCWPVSSWSLVDGESRPKLSYYFARGFFAHVLLSMIEKDGKIEVWVTNDTMRPVKGQIVLRSFRFSGSKLTSKTIKANIPANTSRRCVLTTRKDLKITSTETDFLNARLLVGKEVIAGNNLLFDRIKHLALPKPSIGHSIEQVSSNEFKLTLRSESFAKGCTISFDGLEPALSDNAFDLVPGDDKTVVIRTASEMNTENLDAKLEIRTVRSLKTDSL